jgi:hypothetical protein
MQYSKVPMRTLLIVVAGALLASGCESISESITERVVEEAAEAAAGEGAEIDIDSDDGSMTIETDEGTMTVGGGTELPAEFPASLPVPEEYAVASSMTQSTDDGSSVLVTLAVPGATADLAADIETGLTDGGWTIDESTDLTNEAFASTIFNATMDDLEVSISVTTFGDDTDAQILYSIESIEQTPAE